MNTTLQRRLIWIVMLVLIIAALAYAFQPQPRLVDIAAVTRAAMEVSVEEEGKTRVIDRYIISAPVAGTTCRVDLDVGDEVERDQPLISIKPVSSQALDPRSWAQAQSRVAAAQAALRAAEQNARSAQADAELAQTELKRVQPLAEKGHISRDKLDQATSTVRRTEAVKRSSDFAVDVARHDLEAARTALKYTGSSGDPDPESTVQVRASVSGRILKIHQECEGVVSPGQPLLEIGDTTTLEIETDVLSADAVKIKPGMRVEFNRWGGEGSLQGIVRVVEPVGFTKVSALGVEEQRVLVISDITADYNRWQNLGDGYRVEARFILWEADDVLQIPASALFRYNDSWAVFVVQNNSAKRRLVELGQRNSLHAEITQGLTEGNEVITHPDDSIEDGVAIKRR